VYRKFAPYLGQRVLEVGCGIGNFTSHLLDRAWVGALDAEPFFIEEIRRRFGSHSNLTAEVTDICSADAAQWKKYKPDTIVCSNVLEHIPNDAEALRSMYELLEPGGRIVLLVPAHPFLFGTMDTEYGHVRRYVRKELLEKTRQAGFTIEGSFTLNLFGILGWALNGKLFRRRTLPTGQLKLFEKVAPLLTWIEDHLRVPLGLSWVVVGTKGEKNG